MKLKMCETKLRTAGTAGDACLAALARAVIICPRPPPRLRDLGGSSTRVVRREIRLQRTCVECYREVVEAVVLPTASRSTVLAQTTALYL